jgi:hypothetical protein
MTEKKISKASARKALATLKAWDVTYAKTSKKRLTSLGLEKRQYTDVIGELSLLRGMLVKLEFVISPSMSVRNKLTAERIEALEYGVKRMTPVDVMVGRDMGRVGGVNAFRPLPNRSVVENASGRNRQLGTPRQLFTEGVCPKCEREIGFDIMHWKGNRSSLACCHLVPESYGGTTDFHNVVVGCGECNYQMGSYVDTFTMFDLRRISIIVPIHVEHPE